MASTPFINFVHTTDNPILREGKPTRSSLACLPCRSRHLKCDGRRPECKRCAESQKQCFYAKSRRGGLDRATLAKRREKLNSQPNSNAQESAVPCKDARVSIEDDGAVEFPAEDLSLEDTDLIESYYVNFHRFHPLVVPRDHFERLRLQISGFKPLAAAMCLIGHLYTRMEWSFSLQNSLETMIAETEESNPFLIQSRLLYSIALFWYRYNTEFKREKDAAFKLALDLRIFRKEFAASNGNGDPILMESWRRTWWMIFVLDNYYDGTLGHMEFALMKVEATAELPCEEDEYESNNIPEPKTLQDFDCREFFGTSFSSFAYLIGAVRCVGRACSTAPKVLDHEASARMIQSADSIIDGYLLLLPESRKQVMDKTGEIDELMYQAHLMIHVPLSDLRFNAVEHISSCAREPPPRPPTPELINVHTVRVLRSIEAHIRLLALPAHPFRHTPFTTCMISQSTLALLSACSFLLKGNDLTVARDQIRMSIGCVSALGKIWPRTAKNVQEIQLIARQVIGLEKKTDDSTVETPSLVSGDALTSESDTAAPADEGDLSFSDLCGWSNVSDVETEFSWWMNHES